MVFLNSSLISTDNIFGHFTRISSIVNYTQKTQRNIKYDILYQNNIYNKKILKLKKTFFVANTLSKQFNPIYDIPEDLENIHLVSCGFFTKLINKYWQETIFISVSSPKTDKYINLLRAESLDTYNNQHREFILNFGKALSLGRIQASYVDSDLYVGSKNNIKYIWKKGLNFSAVQFLNNFVKTQIQYIKHKNSLGLVNNFKKSGLPLFTVVNNFNQLIIAEPPDILLGQRNLLDLLYNWLTSYTYNNIYAQSVYQGLFFVNPNDAIEYKEYINNKYLPSNVGKNLRIFSTRLDLYYKLVKNSSSKIHFRLIPDLTELSLLMSKYRYYKNVNFHKKQLWGRNFFQGQPVYLIEPLKVRNKINNQIETVNYTFNVNNKIVRRDHNVFFVNYDITMLAWKNFRADLKMYDLPEKPKITVYNVENLIKDFQYQDSIYNKQFIFIPAQDSYQFLKKYTKNVLSNNVLDKISRRFMPVQIIAKRIFWSLTSRQPTNW
uniref:Ycf80 n=1 Tax=Pterocladia lucida TaxID=31408 RepID=A0A6M3WVY6_PTELU|nr:hypothetical protein [Pterocladia lucida]